MSRLTTNPFEHPEAQTTPREEAPLPTGLDLLVPWELPASLSLSNADQAVLGEALDALEAYLGGGGSDPAAIAAFLARLPDADTRTCVVRQTGSPLSSQEVVDYDRYFLIRRVTSATPGLAMVRSLLTTCQVFLHMCASDSGLEPEAIAAQRRGFLEHSAILRRVFRLGAES